MTRADTTERRAGDSLAASIGDRVTDVHDRGGRRRVRVALSGIGIVTVAAGARTVARVRQSRKVAEALRVTLEHDTLVGEGLGEPTSLIVLGDSAADGYALATPNDAFPWHLASHLATATSRRVRVTSFARDGARTRHVLHEQAPLLRAIDADVIAIIVGVNDVFGRVPPARLRADTHELVQALGEVAPAATVVLIGCPDLGRAPGLPQPLRALVGLRCRQASRVQGEVARAAGIRFVDIAAQTRAEHFGMDGLHPGRTGSLAIARGAVRALVGDGDEPHQDGSSDDRARDQGSRAWIWDSRGASTW